MLKNGPRAVFQHPAGCFRSSSTTRSVWIEQAAENADGVFQQPVSGGQDG
jgi:hypothetical protein